jgi:hypothetical protein
MSDWQTVINWDAGYVAGIKVERERIIKSLKENVGCDVTSGTVATGHLDLECSTCQLIALIKGEK